MTSSFLNLLTNSIDWRAELDGLPFVSLLVEEVGRLEDPFKEDWVAFTN